jgi:hypothetical protein
VAGEVQTPDSSEMRSLKIVSGEKSFWPKLFHKRGREIMLSHCANSQCSKPFLRLREGKLFLVETDHPVHPGGSPSPPIIRARQPQREVEHYWLCDDCATLWTLIYDGDRGIALIPLRRPVMSVSAAASAACDGAA